MLQVSVYKIKVRILVASQQDFTVVLQCKIQQELSFFYCCTHNYFKIQLLIEALGPLTVILSLQTFLQVYLIGEFIIFFKDPKVLILYTFTFCFDTPVHAHFSWRGSRKLMRYLLQHEI